MTIVRRFHCSWEKCTFYWLNLFRHKSICLLHRHTHTGSGNQTMVTSDVIFETVTAHIYNIYRGLKFTKLLHNIVQFQIPITHVHLEKTLILVAMWFLVQMFVCM